MGKKKVSLKDIANRAGVSTALVSYTLNNKAKENRVGKEMAKKIRRIAKEMNYRPNHIAKSLKMGRSNTIGVIVADISNPFFANMARVIEDEAKSRGYTVIFGSSDENVEKSWDLIRVLMDRQVDGFIIAPAEGTEKHIEYLKEGGVPFVLIDRTLPGEEASSVTTDNYKAVYDAIEHLIRLGNRKIGMIAADNQLDHMTGRVKGYQDAMKAHGIQIDPSWLHRANYESLDETIGNYIDRMTKATESLDAIFFATNTIAVSGLKRLNQLNLHVPNDIRVICFDESDAFGLFYCPLTYVKQPLQEIGKRSLELILDQIEKDNTILTRESIHSQLIINRSCGSEG